MEIRPEDRTLDEWLDEIDSRLYGPQAKPLEYALKAMEFFPSDGALLEYAAFAALVEGRPDLSLHYIKRLSKSYFPMPSSHACQSLALAQQGKWPIAKSVSEKLAGWNYAALFPPGLD